MAVVHSAAASVRGLRIRPLRTLAALREVERLQEAVWGFRPRDLVPLRLLRVMVRNGSLVLGAYRGGRLVGFAFGYLGRRPEGWVFCSHMLGVEPRERDRGVGYALKQAQRRWCEAQGFDRMVWTFDPLESRNARFNLHKLRCWCREYWVNLYGADGAGLHRGSATDRFLVEWRFAEPSPNREGARAPTVNPPRRTRRGLPDCGEPDLDRGEPRLRVLIPRDIQALKGEDLGLVRAWRRRTRGIFRTLLRRRYAVLDYDLPPGTRLRAYGSYILERKG